MAIGLVGWIVLHLAIAAGGTWVARRYALSRRLLDQPGERRSHAVPTPRGGGIAIVLAMLVALCALIARLPGSVPLLAPIAAGLVLIAGVGWVDDHRPLSPWLRLAIHAVAAGLLGLACLAAGRGWIAALPAFALALVLVNVWNFMDGIDGIAASQAVIAALAYAIAAGTGITWWLGLALASACIGFLPFNFPQARIFMGDVGSGALGYLLAALAALSAESISSWFWLALPLSAFLVDAPLTLGTRIVRGERWWTPHVLHLYQRLARGWKGHQAVTVAFAAWAFASLALMWIVRLREPATIMCAVCAWYLIGAGIWIWSGRYDGMQPGATE